MYLKQNIDFDFHFQAYVSSPHTPIQCHFFWVFRVMCADVIHMRRKLFTWCFERYIALPLCRPYTSHHFSQSPIVCCAVLCCAYVIVHSFRIVSIRACAYILHIYCLRTECQLNDVESFHNSAVALWQRRDIFYSNLFEFFPRALNKIRPLLKCKWKYHIYFFWSNVKQKKL